MELIYNQAESATKPAELDVISSAAGVYLRKNISEVNYTDMEGDAQRKWVYDECFLTNDEYENYKLEKSIVQNILQEDTSAAYENYKTKFDTPVKYSNGHYYKPKWAESVYAGLLQKGAMLPSIFPLKIWDATELEENAVSMTMAELTTLTIFLAGKQEQYFTEYKIEKTS